ncbi:low temperature requirement protein A [Glycomyces sp. NPDC021274]|uniref:low temperature requirement protein A n=1 Tax=Glycomyces sp. NPDC021274 TaxID=3155120 RepID=UPI0033E575CB
MKLLRGRESPGVGPGASRRARVFAFVLMATGAVVFAVGAVLVLLHPWGAADAAVIAAVLGGPALYVVGDLVHRRTSTGRVAVSRVLALGCLGVFALIALALPALVLAALVLAVLLLLALGASGWFRPPSVNVDE